MALSAAAVALTEPRSYLETLVLYQTEGQKRLGFRIHAMAYVATMVLLGAINLWTGRPYWALWVLPGWTVGLFCHWYFVVARGANGTRGRTS